MPKGRKIEKVKNVIIVVLMLSTILLLYFLWNDDPFRPLQNTFIGDDDVEIISIEDVLYPDKVVISFGAENYTVAQSDKIKIWNGREKKEPSIVSEFAAFCKGTDIAVSQINEEDYIDIMNARSVFAEFSFALPLPDFCSQYGIKIQSGFDNIQSFTSIGYSEASPESFFVCDKPREKYYRLAAGTDRTKFKDLIASVEEKSNPSYYPLGMYLGVNNTTMLPLEMEVSMAPIPYKSNMDLLDTTRVSDMAKTFFGERFDFVRKITEQSGNITYMYGYGQNVLILNTNGRLEYKEETLDTGDNVAFFGALENALNYLAYHKEWDHAGTVEKQIYLKNAQFDPDGRENYRFSFGLILGEEEIHYLKHNAYTVEVTRGGQVVYFERDIVDCFVKDQDGAVRENETLKPVNMLAENFQYIYEGLLENDRVEYSGDGSSTGYNDEIYTEIAERIDDIGIGYLRTVIDDDEDATGLEENQEVKRDNQKDNENSDDNNGDENVLLPVWIVTADYIDFYFDLYDASPIGYQARS